MKTGYMIAGFPETDTVFGETDMVGFPKRANGARTEPGLTYLIQEGVGGPMLPHRRDSRFRYPPVPACYANIW